MLTILLFITISGTRNIVENRAEKGGGYMVRSGFSSSWTSSGLLAPLFDLNLSKKRARPFFSMMPATCSSLACRVFFLSFILFVFLIYYLVLFFIFFFRQAV